MNRHVVKELPSRAKRPINTREPTERGDTEHESAGIHALGPKSVVAGWSWRGGSFTWRRPKKVAKPRGAPFFDYLAESEKYHIEKFNEIYRSMEKDPAWTAPRARSTRPSTNPSAASRP